MLVLHSFDLRDGVAVAVYVPVARIMTCARAWSTDETCGLIVRGMLQEVAAPDAWEKCAAA